MMMILRPVPLLCLELLLLTLFSSGCVMQVTAFTSGGHYSNRQSSSSPSTFFFSSSSFWKKSSTSSSSLVVVLKDTRREFIEQGAAAFVTAGTAGQQAKINPQPLIPENETANAPGNYKGGRSTIARRTAISEQKEAAGAAAAAKTKTTRTAATTTAKERTSSSSTGVKKASSSVSRSEGSASRAGRRSSSSSSGRKGGGGSSSNGRSGGGGRSSGGGRSGGGGRGGSGGGSACFPADAMVEIRVKDNTSNADDTTTTTTTKTIRMEDLEIGDYVRSGTGFSQVYAFGTRAPEDWISFDRLMTDAGIVLEATDNHIMFSSNNNDDDDNTATLMENVQVGDRLSSLLRNQNDTSEKSNNNYASTEVLTKDTVMKQGAFHPYTLDGTIIVNDILVSVHSIDLVAPNAVLGSHIELYDIHEFQQLLFAPLRVLCTKISHDAYCSEEKNHDVEDGSHHWVDVVETLQIFLLPEGILKTANGDDEEEEDEDIITTKTTTNFLARSPYWMMKVFIFLGLVMCSFVEWCTLFGALSFLAGCLLLLLYAGRRMCKGRQQQNETMAKRP